MTCNEFQKQLDAAIDRQLDGDCEAAVCEAGTVELEAHASGCETCRELWQDFVLLERAVTEWRTRPSSSQPSTDFTDRILREIRDVGLPSAEKPSSNAAETKPAVETRRAAAATTREPKPIRAWEIVVTVALVLVAAFAIFRDGDHQIVENDIEDSSSSPFEAPPDNELADLSDLLSDARIALSSLTERASEKAGGFRVFVPNVTNSFTLEPGSGTPAEVLPEQYPQPDSDGPAIPGSDDAESGGFRRALDFLLEAAGPEEQQTT